ncbi:MAG: DMT family protein [Bacteroidota bacterium]
MFIKCFILTLQDKKNDMLRTITLLVFSNIFMTVAWYGHLKQTNVPLWKAIIASWGIAFFEYCLMVPANRIGFANGISGFQLKMIQEVITLVVFAVFAVMYLKEPFHWKYLVSFVLLLGAVYFMFKK